MKHLKLVAIFGLCLFIKASFLFADISKEPAAQSKVTEAPVVTTADGVRVETRKIEVPKHSETKSESKIENNIYIESRGPATGPLAAAAPAVVSAVASEASSSESMSITPLAGITAFQGNWYSHVANRGTVGLIVDIPLVSILSLEAEAQYGKFNVSYSGYGHGFNQYSGGANAKITLRKGGLLQPYLGAGVMAVYYEGLAMGYDYFTNTQNVLGAGQLIVGADINLLGGVSVGARGELLRPFTRMSSSANGMEPYNNNGTVQPSEAAIMSSTFYRILGTVKVSF